MRQRLLLPSALAALRTDQAVDVPVELLLGGAVESADFVRRAITHPHPTVEQFHFLAQFQFPRVDVPAVGTVTRIHEYI